MLRSAPLPKHVKRVTFETDPVVIQLTGDIDEDMVEDFQKNIAAAHTTGQPVIPIVINSNGGEVYSLISMLSMMEAASIPIATIVPGFAGSAACALFACGTQGYRYMAKNARLMMHDVSQMMYGSMTLKEMQIEKQEMKQLNKQVFHAMSSSCKKPAAYFSNLVDKKGGDLYMSASEAKRHGITSVIGIPCLSVKTSVKMHFGMVTDTTWADKACVDDKEEVESDSSGDETEEENEESDDPENEVKKRGRQKRRR